MTDNELSDELSSIKWHKYLDYSKRNFSLYALQMADSMRILHNNIVYNFNETGVGKTVTAGMSVLNFCDTACADSITVLVITFSSDCVDNFIRDWGMLGFTRQDVESGANYKRLGFHKNGRSIDVVLINNNYSNIDNCPLAYPDVIIIDEAHLFFSDKRDSQRYQALTHRYKNSARKVILMTATPTRNNKGNITEIEALGELLAKQPDVRDIKLADHLEKYGKSLPCGFDICSPVSRYFKDTVERSNLAEGKQPLRKQPILWELPYKDSEFYQSAARKIKEEVDNGNRCLVFVRTFNSSNSAESEADCIYKALNDLGVSAECVSADNRSALDKYDLKKSGDLGSLKKVLIVTRVAENGVNLNAFNRVVHLWFPGVPAVIEQRFGRVDRILDRETYEKFFNNGENEPYPFDNGICNIFALRKAEGGISHSMLNFCFAEELFINSCLSSLPSRNILITGEHLKATAEQLKETLNYYSEELKSELHGGFTDFKLMYAYEHNISAETVTLETYLDFCRERCRMLKQILPSYEELKALNKNGREIWDCVFYNDNGSLRCMSLDGIFAQLEKNEAYVRFKKLFEARVKKVQALYKALPPDKLEESFEKILFTDDRAFFEKHFRLLLPEESIWSYNKKHVLDDTVSRYFSALGHTDLLENEELNRAYKELYKTELERSELKLFLPVLYDLPVFEYINKLRYRIDNVVFKTDKGDQRVSFIFKNQNLDLEYGILPRNSQAEGWLSEKPKQQTKWLSIFEADGSGFSNMFIIAHTLIYNSRWRQAHEHSFKAYKRAVAHHLAQKLSLETIAASKGIQRGLFNFYIAPDYSNCSAYINKAICLYADTRFETENKQALGKRIFEACYNVLRTDSKLSADSFGEYSDKISAVKEPDHVTLLKCYTEIYKNNREWSMPAVAFNSVHLKDLMYSRSARCIFSTNAAGSFFDLVQRYANMI